MPEEEDERCGGNGNGRTGVSTIGGSLPHPSDTAALSAIGSGDSSGPYVASFGRLGASGYSVADGFVVRATGGHRDDPVDLDGVGREQLGAQLAALELRCGRRLGDADRPLRLTVLALPRSLEVPIDHGPSGRIAGTTAAPGVRDLADVAALHEAIRERFARFPRHAIAVLAQPDERSVTFTGTLVTRHPAHGMIATHGVWPGGTFGSIGRVPSHALQTDCDAIAAAAEAACTDMCTVAIAITDDTPRVMAVHPAVRSPMAALRVAVDLRDNGLITKAEALSRVPLSLFVPESTGPGRTVTTDVSRLLEWADHETQVPVVDPTECGLPTVRSAADVAALAAGTDGVLIEPTGNPASIGERLWAIADAVDARGIDVAVLALTDSLRRATTTTLPPLPWRAVAGTTRDPAARVLAARLGAGTADGDGRRLD